MEYKLLRLTKANVKRLVNYKKRIIFEYAEKLSAKEISLALERDYRNRGIGTSIIKNIMSNNDIIYLWVYKKNSKAISLYKKIGFKIIDESESRYYMKYNSQKREFI